ncbi:hypothetical protein JCM10212_003543 [Sporobolomyces blumeae]
MSTPSTPGSCPSPLLLEKTDAKDAERIADAVERVRISRTPRQRFRRGVTIVGRWWATAFCYWTLYMNVDCRDHPESEYGEIEIQRYEGADDDLARLHNEGYSPDQLYDFPYRDLDPIPEASE